MHRARALVALVETLAWGYRQIADSVHSRVKVLDTLDRLSQSTSSVMDVVR